jgi:suppressor of G2 allele of SKP1
MTLASAYHFLLLIKNSPRDLVVQTASVPISAHSAALPKQKKNWEKLADTALSAEKAKTTEEDPNAGGDAAVNDFFRQIYAGASDDAKRAMMKSFTESGGTTLSTNWDEVGKGTVEVKPPTGSEARKYEY